MMALLIGQLRIVDGCLWVIGDRQQYPIGWPYAYSWNDDDGTVQLRDENGTIVAKVGDTIEMAGGEVDGDPLDPCLTTAKVWYAVGPVVVLSEGTPVP